MQKKSHAPSSRGLPIGEWAVVENVFISAAGGQYQTTKHQYKMTITEETVMTGLDLADVNNPKLCFIHYILI